MSFPLHVWSFLILYPNCKRPIPAQKWIFNSKYDPTSQSKARKSPAHVRTPLPLPSPRQSHSQSNLKPFRGHGRLCGPCPPWPPQRSAARPRRPRRSKPPHAVPSRLGAEDATRKAGGCGCRRETKRIIMGCFSRWLGKILKKNIRSAKLMLFACFSVGPAKNKRSNPRKICSCSIVLFKSYQQLHLTFAYFRSIMRRVFIETIS